MLRLAQIAVAFFAFVFLTSAASSEASAEDWLQWRGPTGDHHAPSSATAPIEWSETSGIAWSTPVPGRGHSSPTLVGERIYLTTADKKAGTQSLLIYDRSTGRLLRQTVVHSGGLRERIHGNNTHASPTVASDGRSVFAVFGNSNAAWATAFDLDGEQLWQTRALAFDPQKYDFGYGTSPTLVGDVLVVGSEFDGEGSGLAGLDTQTGEIRWTTPRPQLLSYSPSARYPLNGATQLLLSGNYQIALFDPANGQQLWSMPGPWQATCATMVWDHDSGLVFASGGFPTRKTLAVRPGENEPVWENNVICYEQSMAVTGGYLYAVSDAGIAYCWRCTDGRQMWKERLGSGGSFSSSLVLVAGNLYATNEAGTTFVLAASPDHFNLLAENQLGTDGFPTPTPADGRLYHRFGKDESGGRQEYLVAIGI